MRYKTLLIIFTGFVSALSVHQPVQAATYFVSPVGNDTNSGVQTSPWKTIDRANSSLRAGDTLRLAPGTYSSSQISVSGNASTPIFITGNQSVISGGELGLKITGSYLQIDGIEVTGATNHGIIIYGKHIALSRFSIHDNVSQNRRSDGSCGSLGSGGWGSGLSIKLGSEDIDITNGTIYQNCGEGMAATRTINTRVRHVTSYDNFSANFYVDNSQNVLLEKNFTYCTDNTKFYRDNHPAVSFGLGEENYPGWGAQLSNITFVNNISHRCLGFSFYRSEVGGGLKGALIAHNTIWAIWNNRSAINIANEPGNSNIKVVNNIAPGSISTGTGIIASNNINNPNFASTPDYTTNSFKLAAGSVGINAGITLPNVTQDFSGTTRDSHPDIGAFEYSFGQGLSSSPTPIPGDLTGDGHVNLLDFRKLIKYFGDPYTLYHLNQIINNYGT